MRRALIATLLTGLVLPAHADQLSLTLDEVQTVTFPRAVGTVNVGNPSIADITMIDARRAFIQGKGYGTTNIIALGKDGQPVSNTQVVVFSRQASTVTLQRGTQRTTYACTASRCEVTPQPGDGKDSFETASGQSRAHQETARTAAGTGSASD
jgi:Flp pilus assembly secretin CpaC